MKLEDRFLRHVEKTETCWNWTGFRNELGYGKFRLNGKSCAAHRVAYTLWTGDIADGLHVRHTCLQNRRCVNPEHLLLGTHRDNMNDMVRDGTKLWKLTRQDHTDIKTSSLSAKQLATDYGISEFYVYKIKRNE